MISSSSCYMCVNLNTCLACNMLGNYGAHVHCLLFLFYFVFLILTAVRRVL
jgi:hypothetical protein